MFSRVKISIFSICKEIVNCCISQHCIIRYKKLKIYNKFSILENVKPEF